LNNDFLKYQAQTSLSIGYGSFPCVGSYIYDTNNKKILGFCGRSFGLHLGTSTAKSKPSDQRSIRQILTCHGGEYSQVLQLNIAKANGFFITWTIRKTYLVSTLELKLLRGAKTSATRNSQIIISCHNITMETYGIDWVLWGLKRKQIF
jgi:hypothetical protein